MPLQASARTLAIMVCPGNAGALGVVETVISGRLASASASTRKLKALALVFLPSVASAVTVNSPTCPGPGIQLS